MVGNDSGFRGFKHRGTQVMTLKHKLISVGAILAGVFLWGRCSRTAHLGVPVPANVLPKDDNEQILIDPVHKSLIVVNSNGTRTLTLPDRPTTIDIRKNGTINVTSPQYGMERRIFGGVYASDKFRIAAGADLWYFKKLDLGVGLAGEVGPHLPIVFGQVSYNIYSNCRVGLAYGSDRYIGGTLTVRI